MIKRTKQTKADAIRELMAATPDASPAVIAEAMKKRGFKDTTPQYVSTIKSMDKRKSSGTTRRGELTADDLLAAKDFVRQMGGKARAVEALNNLEKLVG
ncbi:hypothetical protein DTL42_23630 [Bremerella cremea]|uniref:Uncharacterized protein n=1 Tax=Bremerella cremea TaxID=1031537 RepID=A0A368KPV7_9BACT|nr:hypothetical protein [Bremerella cremea]RCS41540.1 hypothetical protein DTL42_23630 [Bremerella cremea]